MSDAFIREVDEDIRQKQINDLWKKYGKFVIGIAVGIVVIVAGRAGYTYMTESKYTKEAILYKNAIALNEGEMSAALDPLLNSDVEGYKMLAAFKKSELALANDDTAAAIVILDQFAKDASAPQVYKDIANIQVALMELDTATVDGIRGRLALILNGDTPFKYMASEIVALAELKAGETSAAKSRLEALVGNVDAPASIKNRAEQYLSVTE